MSMRLNVLAAVKALIEGALTGADVRGLTNEVAWPQRIPPNGMVIVRDGDPGDPEIDICPPTYHFSHAIPVEIAAATSSLDLRDQLDFMASKIGDAVLADRHLGGLCQWLEVDALEITDLAAIGTPTQLGGQFTITANYFTTNPLG